MGAVAIYERGICSVKRENEYDFEKENATDRTQMATDKKCKKATPRKAQKKRHIEGSEVE